MADCQTGARGTPRSLSPVSVMEEDGSAQEALGKGGKKKTVRDH